MMNRLNYFLICLFFATTFQLTAQNYAQYSGYMYNKLHLNPAYAGANNQLDMNVFYRDQWTSIEGAPRTININAHTAFKNRTGVGLSLINDRLGTQNQTSAAFSYAYKIEVNRNSKIAAGVSGRFTQYVMDFNSLRRTDEGDINIPTENISSISANFGLGFMWYSDDHYVGLSSPLLLNSNLTGNIITEDNSPIFLMAGKIFDLSRDVKIHPSTLIGYFQSGMKAEISAQVIFKDKIFLGTNYRVSTSIGGLAKYQVNNNLAIGGIYERNTNTLGQVNATAFEAFIEYSFSRNISRNTNIRYF